jgi:homoaconitase/3-isopropylmalate dehydratase large subunit
MESVIDMEARDKKIHKAYIVSCVNSRVQDLAQAAEVN